MAIEFRCPQNHRLSCPEDRAGTIGKCPKCGSTFVVPSAEIAASGSGSAKRAAVGAGATAAVAASDSGTVPVGGAAPATAHAAATSDVIVFLCPNGHKLNCPPGMQGKAGKCPHCGARFVIPRDDELPPEQDYADDGVDEEPLDEGDLDHEEAESDEATKEDPQLVESASGVSAPAAELPPDFLERLTAGGDQPSPTPVVVGAAAPSVLAAEFRELWQYRAKGHIVSLHMRSGAAVSPDRYAAGVSDDHVAFFAVKDADGAYTISAVAWDQVERISVQGLKYLPDELFQ